uniref:ABC-2 type transporter n=1 Tax=Solibacter usitatus (strain Ellin6076) TaxID=234267 RepID=Q027E1_SOLUE
MLFALTVQLLHRVRKFLLAAGVLLAGFQVVLILQANSIQASNSFSKMGEMVPAFARDLMGPSFVMFLTFKGIVCLGYFHPIVMGALVSAAVTLATIPVMEIETGFIDLVLARPVARHWIVTRSILAALISIIYLLAMMAVGTWIGLSNFATTDAGRPSAGLVGSLALNLGFLMFCWAGIAMAIGCACRRRGSAGAIAGLLALTAYLTDYIGRTWKPAESIAWLSPFRYYKPFELLMGAALPAKSLYVLGGIAAAAFALAYLLYSRRDISH